MNIRRRKLAPLALSLLATGLVASTLVGFRARSYSASGVTYLGWGIAKTIDNAGEHGAISQDGAGTLPPPMTTRESGGYVETSIHSHASNTVGFSDRFVVGELFHSFGISTFAPHGTHRYVQAMVVEEGSPGADATISASTSNVAWAKGKMIASVTARAAGSSASDLAGTNVARITHVSRWDYSENGTFKFTYLVDSLLAQSKVTGPMSTVSAQVPYAQARGTSTSKISVYSYGVRPSPVPAAGHSGSPFAKKTSFNITRSDNVVEPVHAFQRNEDGTLTISGFGFPDNTTLTFEMIQPGFLRQTSIRKVMNEDLYPHRVRTGQTPAVTPLDIDCVFGDADGDNDIDSNDVAIINGYVGLTKTDEAFYEPVPNSALVGGQLEISVSDLDENQDGAITAADVAVATANVGRTL